MNEENKPVETVQTPVQAEKKKMNPALKLVLILVPAFILFIIIVICLFNAITTKTLKCKYETESGDVVLKVQTKEKFRFHKPVYMYVETVRDYSEGDYTKADVRRTVDSLKKDLHASCKKSDGCTFSVYQKDRKKIKIIYKMKYSNAYIKNWEKNNDYKEYIEMKEDSCEDMK